MAMSPYNPDIVCHKMIIMSNHFHCIWGNVGLHGALVVGAATNL